MTVWRKWAFRIGAAILIAAISIVCTLLYVAIHPKPGAPLTAGLQGKWADMSAQFNRRVQQRFPVGSPEQAMTDELRREGFVREDWAYQVRNSQGAVAIRYEPNFVCNQGAIVSWRADPEGHITSIHGEYREMRCL